MSNSQEPNLPSNGQFLVYRAEDGRVQIDVRLEKETVWLTQQHMADLFQSSKQNVGQHLKRIFEEGELTESSVVKNFFTTAADGKEYRTNYYNLDAIISVGYRITSAVATRFRIWATQKLREFIVKGFVLDDERLKNPDQPFDYFEELLRRIQDIRADSSKPHMGLTNWRGAKVRKQDVTIAKNYLNEEELAALNNLVEQYLIFAEGQAMRRVPMHMRDWIAKLNGFLTLNERAILNHAGKISHDMARELAEAEYDKFRRKQIQQADQAGGDFDKAIKQLPPPPKRKSGGKK
jgi:hypothetical protein